MVQLYARANYNSNAARRLYAEPQHLVSLRLRGILNPQVPQARTIVAVTQRLLDHGQFNTPAHAHMHYQHDGCPTHYQRTVREHLDSVFPQRWVGRGGPVPWPARSPDLTTLDFYLWSELKRLVYREEHETRDGLMTAIVDAFDTVRRDRDILVRLKDNQLKRARLCIERNGLHFELLRYREV